MKINFTTWWLSVKCLPFPFICLLLVGMMVGLNNTVSAQETDADQILGTWLTQKANSKIQMTRVNARYSGAVVWLAGTPNTETAGAGGIANTPAIGLQILSDFKYDGSSTWSGGKIFVPEKKKKFDARLKLKNPDTLEIRISAGLLHETVTWTRSKLD